MLFLGERAPLELTNVKNNNKIRKHAEAEVVPSSSLVEVEVGVRVVSSSDNWSSGPISEQMPDLFRLCSDSDV